ncbi:unnamed protein product [Cylicostephanus goldi]|uniref:Uncharacterized protein n=1 Tax=Cylicostephanus goldi TaxID=71465 RepID=A0A3P7N9E2_CYLGO|nr:unnamed protein product [Cylicostephanus goldi]
MLLKFMASLQASHLILITTMDSASLNWGVLTLMC